MTEMKPLRTEPRIRDAATVIVLRDRATRPKVLMGTRGAGAAFMPNKVVFPGGAVDPGDAEIPLAQPIAEPCHTRLADHLEGPRPETLVPALTAAAIRELWEETGQILGTPDDWPGYVPPDWRSFAASGHRPSGAGLRFVFRAITPPGRPRRFDARFFLVEAAALASDPDDFSAASDELSHLQWVPLDEIRDHDLPFITEVVLAEIAAAIGHPGPPDSVPFFRNDDEESLFLRLHGKAVMP